MKLLVLRKDGRRELLTLVPPISFAGGGGSYSGVLLCGDGTEHYFREDGTYDGWSRAVNMDFQQAQEEIERVESGREIEDEPDAGAGG